MTEMKKKSSPKGLGRGLASLIPEVSAYDRQSGGVTVSIDSETEQVSYVLLTEILPNSFQPRTLWNQEKLQELAESIKTTGLLQPLLVRPLEFEEKRKEMGKKYELIAGERRLRALKIAGFEKAPIIIKQVDRKSSLEMAIVENIQREDLNPVDEALAYRRLLEEFRYSQEELSNKVGRDRSTVTNCLRLLNLSGPIQKSLSEGKISAGHARALLSLSGDRDRESLVQLIIRKGLSVREAERLVREAHSSRPRVRKQREVNPELRFMEEKLMASLGTKVSIKHRGRRGKIEIEYYSLEDLNRVVNQIEK